MGDVSRKVRAMVAMAIMFMAATGLSAQSSDEMTYFPYEGEDEASQGIEQELPDEPVGSARGEVLFVGNGSTQDVYVRLGDEGNLSYELDMEPLEQGAVELEVPVNWTQRATVTSDETVMINLWNHNDSIPDSFLTDVLEMEVRLDGEVISEVPIFQVPNGTSELTIRYTTPAVHREIICEEQRVLDLLPAGAELIGSDLPVDTIVQEVCRIRLYHESHTPYEGVSFAVTEIAQEDILSIYSVEGGEYLYLRNDSVMVPRR